MCAVRRAASTGVVGLLLLLASPAFAQDRAVLRAEIDVSQDHDSNVFNTSQSSESDLLTAITPRLDFEMRGETGTVDLGVGGRYKRYWSFQEQNGFDPFAELRVNRRLTPKLIFTLNGSFRERSSIDDVFDDQLVVNGDEIEQSRQTLFAETPKTVTQDLSLGFRYQLTPVQSFTLNFGAGDESHDRLRFDPINRRVQPRDIERNFLSVGYERRLTPRDRIGLGVTRQWFQTEGSDPADPVTQTPRTDREDEVIALTTNWTRQWSPRWTTGLSGGVRFLEPDGSEVPGLVEQVFDPNGRIVAFVPLDTSSDANTGFVGSFDVGYRSLIESFALGYTRETRPQSGSSGSLDVDRVIATYSRSFGRRFNLALRARYEKSQSAAEIQRVFPISDSGGPAGDSCRLGGGTVGLIGSQDQCVLSGQKSDSDRTDQGAGVSFGWRIRSNLTTLVSYDFLKSELGGRNRQSYHDHRVSVGLRYDYEIDLF